MSEVFFFYGNCVAGRTHRFFFFRCSLTSFIYGCASFSLSLSFLCVVEERFLACLGRALRGHIAAEEYFCAYIHMSSLALLLLFLCFRQSLAFRSFFLVVSLAQNCENEGYTYIYICVYSVLFWLFKQHQPQAALPTNLEQRERETLAWNTLRLRLLVVAKWSPYQMRRFWWAGNRQGGLFGACLLWGLWTFFFFMFFFFFFLIDTRQARSIFFFFRNWDCWTREERKKKEKEGGISNNWKANTAQSFFVFLVLLSLFNRKATRYGAKVIVFFFFFLGCSRSFGVTMSFFFLRFHIQQAALSLLCSRPSPF